MNERSLKRVITVLEFVCMAYLYLPAYWKFCFVEIFKERIKESLRKFRL